MLGKYRSLRLWIGAFCFSFRSDYSGTAAGVWVDNINIQKYQ